MSGKKRAAPRNLEDIDQNLRSAYQGLLEEALPPQFEDLIDQLRRGDIEPGDKADGEAEP